MTLQGHIAPPAESRPLDIAAADLQTDPLLDIRGRAFRAFVAYCARVGLSERQFGDRAVGDHRLIERLGDPAYAVRVDRIERARTWMLAHPDGPTP